jgi:hypothetical protein
MIKHDWACNVDSRHPAWQLSFASTRYLQRVLVGVHDLLSGYLQAKRKIKA